MIYCHINNVNQGLADKRGVGATYMCSGCNSISMSSVNVEVVVVTCNIGNWGHGTGTGDWNWNPRLGLGLGTGTSSNTEPVTECSYAMDDLNFGTWSAEVFRDGDDTRGNSLCMWMVISLSEVIILCRNL